MEDTRFLPPEPPGPEPEIAARPAKEPPPPPPPQQTYGYPPPPPGAPGQPPPGYRQPPPGYQQPPPGYQQPPPGYAYPSQPWGAPQQPVPDNGQAVAGFVLSLVAAGLLVISFGLSTIVSLGLAIGGVICSRNGKRRVDAGETPKHRGLAQAGFIVGWVSIGLSILAIVAWILIFAFEGSGDESIFDPDTTRALREAVGV